MIQVVSPITEELLATVPEAMPADIDKAVAAARKAFDEGPWPRMTPAERAPYLIRIQEEVEKRFDAMTEAFTAEIGAPAGASVAFHNNALKMWGDASTLHERFEFEEERSWAEGTALSCASPSASSPRSFRGTAPSPPRR